MGWMGYGDRGVGGVLWGFRGWGIEDMGRGGYEVRGWGRAREIPPGNMR